MPLFNGSSYLKYHGLGYSTLSWLDMEIILKPTSPDGIVLYNGHKIDGMGDFIAVYMSAGYLTFTFDLGTGSATIRYILYLIKKNFQSFLEWNYPCM